MAHSTREYEHAVKSEEQLYFPLPVTGNYIRLLELAPGAQNDHIIVRMFVTALEEAPEYDALSYVWGAPGATLPVVCNGIEIVVTANLGMALQRVRYIDRSRRLWADAICIDQTNLHERGHHVGFMGKIYERARMVLVILGPDPDGGAERVKALVEENAAEVAKYGSVEQMPILSQDDPLFDDPRWKAMSTMTNCVWFTRTWVVQEVGLASNPRAHYGSIEFSYKDLMTLASWHTRCASHLTPRHNVDFTTIHVEWLDWKLELSASETQDRTFLDLLNHARWLACMDPRDHVYAFLGHPLAQHGDNSEMTIVKPDYSKPFEVTYLELAIQLLRHDKGLRILSTVEHDEHTMNDDYPSWVTRWNVENTMCTLGIFSGFYYNAHAGVDRPYILDADSNTLSIKGIFFDCVTKVFPFSSLDLTEPVTLLANNPDYASAGTLAQIWAALREISPISPEKGSGDGAAEPWLESLALTLTAGLSGPNPAEEDLKTHMRNFAAYSALTPGVDPGLATATEALKGDPHRYWLDVRQVCEGRSFVFTEKGHLALAPLVTEPGACIAVVLGAKVPFVLRRATGVGARVEGSGVGGERYRLVGEAYVHGFMRGEAVEMLGRGELEEDMIVLS